MFSFPQITIISRLVKRYFGQDSLEWFHRHYLLDWTCVGLLWFFSYIVSFFWTVFERDFSPKDVSISHPHRSSQVGSFLNFSIALFAPLLLLIVVGCLKRSILEIHHGTLALFASRGLARLVTEYLKHKIGRLRPDFLARCKWDKATGLCTGWVLSAFARCASLVSTGTYSKAAAILEGRKSFPSGHSSTAFAGMIFMSLWIAGQTAALCPTVMPPVRWLSSRMVVFLLILTPISWATHVAVTRVEDYRHHKEDVIIGSLIGIASAFICYLLFWSNPFCSNSFNKFGQAEPRRLYETGLQSEGAYGLIAVDDENTINHV